MRTIVLFCSCELNLAIFWSSFDFITRYFREYADAAPSSQEFVDSTKVLFFLELFQHLFGIGVFGIELERSFVVFDRVFCITTVHIRLTQAVVNIE